LCLTVFLVYVAQFTAVAIQQLSHCEQFKSRKRLSRREREGGREPERMLTRVEGEGRSVGRAKWWKKI